MNFLHPSFFLLFLLLIPAAYWVLKRGVRFRSRIFFPSEHWVKKKPKSSLPSPFRLHWIFRVLALSFIIIGLARPQEHFTKVKRFVEAIDIIIAFDLSKSMDALDFKPNRRTVAIETIQNFIDKRIDDRMGLVLFSGEAYMAVPPTLDHKVVKDAVQRSSNRGLQDGTAIGQAIAVATHHLKDSEAKSKIVILVTDGDNNMGSVDPITAASIAQGYGVKVYTIGLGKKGRVAFPVKTRDVFGREVQVLQYLTDAANDQLLEKISQMTDAQFFSATKEQILEKVFEQIDDLEKTKVETRSSVRRYEKAWLWIFLALLSLFLEHLALNTRWRKLP